MRDNTIFKIISLFLFALIFAFPFYSYAQTTGSIGGTVVDAKDKSPLIGATVKITGTNIGAVTDDNGNYVILNVDVGNYTIEASFIGFETQRITNVKVSVDMRNKINFELPVSGEIKTEVIEVEAERKGIEVEQSGRLVESEQITNQGIRGITNIVSKTAGVVQDERGGAINIRGSRSTDNVVIVDGVVTNNPLDGSLASTNLANSLIQEIAVLTGGFGAEYGNAIGGVINVTTKGGTDKYSGSFEAVSDFLAGKWISTLSQGYNLYNVTFGGPLIPTKSLSKVINFYGGVERQFLLNRNPSWGATRWWSDGIIPNYTSGTWSYSARLSINFSEIKNQKLPFILKGGYLRNENKYKSVLSNLLYLKNNSERNILNLTSDDQIYARFIHNVSSKFFYELQGSYFHSKTEYGDPVFFADVEKYADTVYNKVITTQGQGPYVYDPATGNVFVKYGNPYYYYVKNEVKYIGLKLDATYALLTKKLGNHEVKFGGEYKYHSLYRFQVYAPSTAIYSDNPISNWYSTSAGNAIIYGYNFVDKWGRSITGPDETEPRHPIIGSFYIRDKVDFGDFTFNAGLRVDYFDVNTKVLKNPNYVENKGVVLPDDALEDSKMKFYFSPRLGFSFPVTDKLIFVAQYGRFIQLPPLQYLYINPTSFRERLSAQVQQIIQNSGLQPEKLTSYEVGLKQRFGDYIDAGLTVYYRETKDQITTTNIPAGPNVSAGYGLYVNQDYSISRGFEFYLSLRRFNRLAADISYSLAYASGTGSNPSSKASFTTGSSGLEPPRFTYPLDYDQRHTASINLDYRFGATDVPKGIAGHILKNLGLNVLLSFNSGRPYTPRSVDVNSAFSGGSAAIAPKNSVYRDWTYRVDMKLDKGVQIWKTYVDFYVYVINLLNTEIINNIYESTGLPDDNGYMNTPDGQSQSQAFKENWYYRINNPFNWGPPRQVRFGVKVNF